MNVKQIALGFAALAGLPACGCSFAPPDPKIVARIPAPDGYWDYASFDPLRHRVLVGRSYGALAVDVGADKVSQAASGEHVHAALPLPNGRILMTNGEANQVTLANGLTGAIEARISVGHDPDAAIYDASSGKAFVMNGDSGDVSVVDPDQGKEDMRIPVAGKLEGGAVDGEGMLFVNVADKGQIAVIDIRSGRVMKRFTLAGCTDPTAIAYIKPDQAVLTTCGNGHAKFVSALDGRERADIPIGPHPDAAVFDQARGRVYISTAGLLMNDGEITVLRLDGQERWAASARIATQRGARTMAEDPKSGRLYLPTATYALGLDGQPHPRPRTFKILVVQP